MITTVSASFSRRYGLALILVGLVQTCVLGQMVWQEVSLRLSGREVLVETQPVDPRSLFRGDYVRLSYAFSRLRFPSPGLQLDAEDGLKPGAPVWLTLKKDESGSWHPTRISAKPPAAPSSDHRVTLRGKVKNFARFGTTKQLISRYGIESYFVPEGEGRRLEKLVRSRQLSVLIAVHADGRAAIKGLAVDGKVTYEEPLF